jgi:hypothetical protein
MPPVSVTMQARNLPPPPAAAGLDDVDVAGVELLVFEDDDPQAAASRAISPKTAAIRIFALKMYLLCPGAPKVPGDGRLNRRPRPAGAGKVRPDPPGIARRLVRRRLAGKAAAASGLGCCEIETVGKM